MLHISRRSLLASSAAAVAVTSGSREAGAYLGRRVGGSVITSITLVNTSGNATKPGAVTQLVGCPFKKGDIAKGTWPQFQLGDGTNLPCTILDRLATTWKDGSLKFVPVMLSIPRSVPGNGSRTVNILAGGQMPAPSPRRLSDFRQGIEPQIQVDGLDNLSGTWIMHLKQAIKARTNIVSYGNGAAGAVWKVRANARQSGADHGQLLCDFYIASLANPDGSLKGLRILGKVKLPYYDSPSNLNWLSFSRFQLMSNSTTVLHDCFGNNFGSARAFDFAWASGSVFDANHGYSIKCGGDYGYCVRLSSTGTLPTGLTTDTSYFTASPKATTIGFSTNASNPGGRKVSATGPGTGTQTATPYPYIAYFGALFTATSGGEWDFLQGSGSDTSDTTLIHQMNQPYLLSTELIPPYNLAIGAVETNVQAGFAQAVYWPNSAQPVERYLHVTGERNDLGIIHGWGARHFFTQDPGDQQFVRVVSLVGAQMSVGMESIGTLSYPCVNNGHGGGGSSYAGMPAPDYSFRWAPNDISPPGRFSGAGTLDPNVLIAGFNELDSTHMPQFNYYAYLVTGEPWHLDALLEAANNAVMNPPQGLGTATINTSTFVVNDAGGYRNTTVGTNPTRYGAITTGCNGGGLRNGAWASGIVNTAAGICSDRHPVCGSYKQYFRDMASDGWNLALDVWNQLNIGGCTYGYDYGMWTASQAETYQVDQYQLFGYMLTAAMLSYRITENADAAAAAQAFIPWADHVVAKWSGWHLGAEQVINKQSTAAGAPVVTSDAQIGFGVAAPIVNWTNSGSNPFTWVSAHGPSNYAISNGDVLVFVDSLGCSPHTTPAGYSKYTRYYVVGLSQTSFGLALTLGGTALAAPTDTYFGKDQTFFISSKPPSTGSVDAVNGNVSFNTMALAGLHYAQACGLAVKAATIADLQKRDNAANNGNGVDFASCPKYAMRDTFSQNGAKRYFSRRISPR